LEKAESRPLKDPDPRSLSELESHPLSDPEQRARAASPSTVESHVSLNKPESHFS